MCSPDPGTGPSRPGSRSGQRAVVLQLVDERDRAPWRFFVSVLWRCTPLEGRSHVHPVADVADLRPRGKAIARNQQKEPPGRRDRARRRAAARPHAGPDRLPGRDGPVPGSGAAHPRPLRPARRAGLDYATVNVIRRSSSTLANTPFDLRLREPGQLLDGPAHRRRAGGTASALGPRSQRGLVLGNRGRGREQRLARSLPPPTRRLDLGVGHRLHPAAPGRSTTRRRSDRCHRRQHDHDKAFGGRTSGRLDGVLEALSVADPTCCSVRASPSRVKGAFDNCATGRACRSGARQLREPRLVERSPLPASVSRPASRWAASSWSARLQDAGKNPSTCAGT